MSERLTERTADYLKALAQLQKALAMPYDEFIRDSVIQRFEFTYELAWKMLKIRVQQEGIEALSPKQVLQEALSIGLITDGNRWSALQKNRNLTTHTYDETLAEQIYQFIAQTALPLFEQLKHQTEQWRSTP